MIRYYCNKEQIEDNALSKLLESEPLFDNICVFPDIHYCSEKSIPVGVAFETTDVFNPLVIGKDIGCGVMFLRFSSKDWLKKFNKSTHYKAFNKASLQFSDEGLGGGNHFLSIEDGNDGNTYIICHTGSRNLGIFMNQQFQKMINDFNYKNQLIDINQSIPIISFSEGMQDAYNKVLNFGNSRREEFVTKTLQFLINNSYVKPKVHYEIKDSIHNVLRIEGNKAYHRKGATELNINEVVIPISMTRGSIIVKPKKGFDMTENLWSCAHGAGRKLSRTDTLKHWHSMKKKEKKLYEDKFCELLDRSGKFSSGLLQEFDFAYKNSESILKDQPFLQEITRTTPIVTVKFSEV